MILKKKLELTIHFPKSYKKQLVLKDILKNVPHSLCAVYNDKKKEILKYVKPGGCWRDLPDEYC